MDDDIVGFDVVKVWDGLIVFAWDGDDDDNDFDDGDDDGSTDGVV